MMIIEKLSFLYRSALDRLYNKTHHLSIMTIEETLLYIIDNKCSVARYGDGEFDIIFGSNIGFQKSNEALKEQLSAILKDNTGNCLICLPGAWEHPELYTPLFNKFWKKHLIRNRKTWYSSCLKDYRYGNADITRCYMGIKDKTKSKYYFDLNKKLWDEKDILIVEGSKSRLGIGNDLFNNCRSIRRILCPARNAYNKIDEIIEAIQLNAKKDTPIFVALGPTATVICYELSKQGYFAVDIGNLDKEYEWFENEATQKTANPIKDIIEISVDGTVMDCLDEKYLKEVICKIEE